MKRISLLILTLILMCQVNAQTKLTGKVVDAGSSEPIIGATVQAPGAKGGVVSDIEGNFTITLPANAKSIVVSSIGYTSQTINIKGKSNIRIALKEDNALLDELVVVGYGTMKKSDLSGALSQLKGDELIKGGAMDIAHGMQGKIAGVQVQQSDGAPGGGMSIVIRGTNSYSTSSQPLYIVDGVPMETGGVPSNGVTSTEQGTNPLSNLNPHDIENIEVLKDASATAIYGSRGANGVVIITTKKGQAGKPKVEMNANFGWQKINKKIDMLDPFTYATYINEQADNDRYYAGSTSTNIPYPGKWGYKYYADGHPNYNLGTYTGSPEDYINPGWHYDEYGNSQLLGSADWQDEIFQTANSQDYSLSVSGGTDKAHYMFSGGYTKQDGIIKNSGYERYTLRTNLSSKVADWLEVGTSTGFTRSTTNFANTLSYNTSIVRSALLFPVTYSPDMDTTYSDDLNWLASNPAAYVNSTKDQLKGTNWFSSSFLEVTFCPWLKFRQNLGISFSDNHRGAYYGRHTQDGKAPTNGKASKGVNTWEGITAESILTFDKQFGKYHHLNVMGAFTIEQGKWDNWSQTYWNFPDDLTQDNNVGRALEQSTSPSSGNGMQRLASFLGRVNYTLKDRYLFTASLRSDGSSKFTTKNKWATFASGAIAWRASEEEFIKNLHIFSNLKFRVSFGQTGNQGIGSYSTISFVEPANYPFDNTLSGGVAMNFWSGSPVDPNLRWETTNQWNGGIDFGFMDNRLTFTIDAYYKKTNDLLQNIKIPTSTGFNTMTKNSGNVTNKGLELTLDYKILQSKDWNWSVNANMAFNKNEIGGLEGDQYANTLWYNADNVFIQRNGCPIGAIFGYIEDGFYNNEAEVRADPQYTFSSASVVKNKVGEIKYRDVNHDGVINDDDRVIIGDTNPDFLYGFSSNLSWKDLTLSFLFQGSKGNDIFNGNLQDVTLGNVGNIPQFAYDTRWTEANMANAAWPKATGGYDRSFKISNRYVEDASYFRLKNISLTYNWRRPLNGIDNMRISFMATNVFTISSYSWYDPDVNAFGTDSSRRGVDIYSYPLSRTFSFGLGLTF